MTAPGVSRAQTSVAAEELALDFTWTAPDTCPTRAEVIAELSKAVDAGGKELPPLTARAVVKQDGGAWRLELTTEMDGRRGTRLLEADSCEGLARAATLVLALTLGEGLARRLQAEAEARAAQPKAPPEPAPEKPPARPAPPSDEPARVLLWAAGAVGSDPLGAFGPALVLGGAFQPNLFKLGARLEATFPRSTEFVGSGGYVRSFSFSADLQACLAPTLLPFQFSVCANGGVTLLDAKGQGTARDSHASVPLYGLGPSANVLWLLHEDVFLNLGVGARFFLQRPELVVEGVPQRRRIETASGSGELGMGVRF